MGVGFVYHTEPNAPIGCERHDDGRDLVRVGGAGILLGRAQLRELSRAVSRYLLDGDDPGEFEAYREERALERDCREEGP